MDAIYLYETYIQQCRHNIASINTALTQYPTDLGKLNKLYLTDIMALVYVAFKQLTY